MTRLVVRSRLDWTATGPATAMLLIRAAASEGQDLVDETLEVRGADVEDIAASPDGGARPLRLHLEAGPVGIHYAATVDVHGAWTPDDAPLPTLRDMDLDLVTWTLPSRYCPSDVLAPTTQHLFGAFDRTGALLEHIRWWVQTNIAYVPGTSDVHTAADETMLRRTGVCRDLAHLTVSLLRGLGIPARMVAAYALDLDPPDFHAVVEAHDGRAWRLLDATGLAPVDTLVRIATGHDAAEIAWGTTEGPVLLDLIDVSVTRGTPPTDP